MSDVESQPITLPLTNAAIFLVLSVKDEEASYRAVRQICTNVGDLVKAVGFRNFAEDLSCIMGIGSEVWDKLFPQLSRPKHLHPFIPISGVHDAPSTPGDLLFHIRASNLGYCFELAQIIRDQLGDAVEIIDETHGFRYFDHRDLLGFVDGTANPTGNNLQHSVYIGEDDPDHTGGSYVIVQKYFHDLKKWRGHSVEKQEQIIGRHKLNDVEIPDDEKASFSHVSLNTIEDDDGNELDIYRGNMVFGSIANGEGGTYYIGYACDPIRQERMLNNMFVGNPPGNYDRLLDVSTATTGTLFFIPSQTFLDNVEVDPTGAAAPAASSADDNAKPGETRRGSLGIGSLKKGK